MVLNWPIFSLMFLIHVFSCAGVYCNGMWAFTPGSGANKQSFIRRNYKIKTFLHEHCYI